MKIILNIAKAELQKLFYSPVAWLILVIFTIQLAMGFTSDGNGIGGALYAQLRGYAINDLTYASFSDNNMFFFRALNYLYLYIPMLTMGIMSKEFSTGSIKLLYSSPITNQQIVIGKFVSIMVFGLALIAILSVFCVFGVFAIEKVDWPLLLCGLFGIYLLILAYGAVGLFISSLTSYMVVAAIGTIAIFTLLNYLSQIGADIPVIRDITYWIGFNGRDTTFIAGMLTTEDLLYFIVIISAFLSFTILKLQSGRQKLSWKISWLRYFAVIVISCTIGYFSSMPKFKGYVDVTHSKRNTLTVASQEVMKTVPYGSTITTYVNMLDEYYFYFTPDQYKRDVERFSLYLRFRPDLNIKYVYYYHEANNTVLNKQYPKLSDKNKLDKLAKLYKWDFPIASYDKVAKSVDLAPEKFRCVRVIETPKGKKEFLRVFDDPAHLPSETETTAAFKRLTMKIPTVGFLQGHRERSIHDSTDKGYFKWSQDIFYRFALVNQGFDTKDVSLAKSLSSEISILVIADPKERLSAIEQKHLDEFTAAGGNLMILSEPGRQENINPIAKAFGVNFFPGMLVHEKNQFSSDLTAQHAKKQTQQISFYFDDIVNYNWFVTMPTAGIVGFAPSSGFKAVPLFQTDSATTWNSIAKLNLDEDSLTYTPASGPKGFYTTALAVSRRVGRKDQRAVFTSDADWLSNSELSMNREKIASGNYQFMQASFHWLSEGEAPIDTRRLPVVDNSILITEQIWLVAKYVLRWAFPIIMALIGIVIWIRRKGL